jgi:PPOX class probable F420-dependent enzyme
VDERVRLFLDENHAAAMITLRRDGTPHAVRVGVGLVDGKIWSSGTRDRVRTKHLRRDPRSTLFVFDTREQTNWRWLALECAVRILEGPEVPGLSLSFFRLLQQNMPVTPGHVMWYGQEKTEAEFLKVMADEGRVIYEFDPLRIYGMY